MSLGLVLLCGMLGAADGSAGLSCLIRMERTVAACKADIPAMQAPAEDAAARLAKGGKLWAAGQPSVVGEISGRAGGLMMIRPLGDAVPDSGDVVLYGCEQGVPLPAPIAGSGARVVMFGGSSPDGGAVGFSNHAGENGVSQTLANAIPAWIFTGELTGALTRLGKMPVVFETIGAYGGFARIQQYKRGETAFHDDMTVPAVAAGVIGNRFADAVTAKLQRVEKEQRLQLDKTGTFAREAREQQKQLFMYSMGHLFPDEIGKTKIGKAFRSAGWSAGFRAPHPEDAYGPGDVAVLIGYQHPADELLRKARPAGAKVAYVALRPDRDFTQDPDVVWIDPMWDWADGCVSLEGYDVPLLPASGIVNGAIAWEIYRLATGDEAP